MAVVVKQKNDVEQQANENSTDGKDTNLIPRCIFKLPVIKFKEPYFLLFKN